MATKNLVPQKAHLKILQTKRAACATFRHLLQTAGGHATRLDHYHKVGVHRYWAHQQMHKLHPLIDLAHRYLKIVIDWANQDRFSFQDPFPDSHSAPPFQGCLQALGKNQQPLLLPAFSNWIADCVSPLSDPCLAPPIRSKAVLQDFHSSQSFPCEHVRALLHARCDRREIGLIKLSASSRQLIKLI